MREWRIACGILCILLITLAGCVQPGSKQDAKTGQDTSKPITVMTRQTLSFGDDTPQSEKGATVSPTPTPTKRKELAFSGSSSRIINETGLSGNSTNSTATTTTTIIPLSTIPAPIVFSITPNSQTQGITGNFFTIIEGTNLFNITDVRLTRSGQSDIIAANIQTSSTQIFCTINIAGAVPGQWNVMVWNQAGQSGIGTNLFTVRPVPLVAAFTSNVTSGSVPLAVSFIDLSTGSPTGWIWTFGDTQSSIAQHPVHIYSSPGMYHVNLTIINTERSNTTPLVYSIRVT